MKTSVFEASAGKKNPLLSAAMVMLIGLFVIDFGISLINNRDIGSVIQLFWMYLESIFITPYYLSLLVVIILSGFSNKSKVVFNILKFTFWIPVVLLCITYINNIDLREALIDSFLYFFTGSIALKLRAIYFIITVVYLLLSEIFISKSVFYPYREKGQGYLYMPLHIMLLLILPFAWKTVWVYKTTKALNNISSEVQRSPLGNTLLCLLIPFYSLYWTYSTARRSDVVAVAKGLPSNTATLCLILQIFLPFIPPMIIQDKINQVVSDDGTVFKALQELHSKREQKKETETEVNNPAPPTVTMSVPDELKKYKDLLDCGAITQEEYDKKKAELLSI